MSATQTMREQRMLALALLVGALFAAAPAQALRRCAPNNAHVMVQNAFVQAFSTGTYGNLAACLRSTGKTEVLADEGWMYDRVALARDVVGWIGNCYEEDCGIDLWYAASYRFSDGASPEGRIDTFDDISSVAVNVHGDMAWIVCYERATRRATIASAEHLEPDCRRPLSAKYSVWTFKRTRSPLYAKTRFRDTGRTIFPFSLRLGPRRVTWRHGDRVVNRRIR